ncbi:MAG TPA: tRNA pseudouridine(55) synthase TruB [Kofleriaceae bacterium]|nr:tRNA pseudouridine(55) synthase TruB [Kofleriaceae bacterium]
MGDRPLSGVLVLDKPAGMSSAAAVERVKRELGARRAGHAGTLDPIATGVLPICLDEATKLAGYLLADDKAYEAEAVLGVETDTLDRTGAVVATRPIAGVTRERALAAIAARTGEHDQLPPLYSAIKQGGVRMYRRARAGEQVERAPRRVRIDRLELLAFEPPRLRLAIACSKGTYVRSLVADLGADLGCGAHLGELRRTRSGVFAIADAVAIDAIATAPLVGLVDATGLPIVEVAGAQVPRVRSGVQMPPAELAVPPANYERFQLVDEARALVAIAHVEAGRVVYDRVFGA